MGIDLVLIDEAPHQLLHRALQATSPGDYDAEQNARTLAPGRRQVNLLATRKQEHSRKPDEQYEIIEACSPGPFFELFARGTRRGWTTWGDQAEEYRPTWKTYANHSQAGLVPAE